jgi:two-component SAPR family response regulator
MKGDLPAAVNELTKAAGGWRRMGRTSNLGWVLNNLGMAHLSVGDFESASITLEEAVREAKSCENPRNLAYAMASLGDARLAAGEYAEARGHFEEAVRLCSVEFQDETLAALSIAGLAACFLGLNDLQQADYFAERAMYIAEAAGAPYELGTCLVTQAAVQSAAQAHHEAVDAAGRAVKLFNDVGADAPLRTAYYRQALCLFRAKRKPEAEEAVASLAPLMHEPWMQGVLIPAIRENPMFAQWVAARGLLGPAFAELLHKQAFVSSEEEASAEARSKFPRVAARSLGRLNVTVDGRDVADEEWASIKSKELFYLFLANPAGIRKEEAVEQLYPELEPEKCNSAFHSNLYRVRRALYADSVVKRDGAYMLNPEGEFEWDVAEFEAALGEAQQAPHGSEERASLYRRALDLYRGPFAEAFYSEWAASIRHRTEERAGTALSTLAGYHAGRGDYELAAECMEQLLGQSHTNEEAAYQLATFRARAGQPAVALAFIDSFAKVQERELGVDLPRRFRELRSRIASGIAV